MELRKHFSSLVLASLLLTQAQSGAFPIFSPPIQKIFATQNTVLPQSLLDRVLASLPANMPSTLVIGPAQDPAQVRSTANDKLRQFGLTTMFEEWNRASALRHEGTTMQAICNLFGYSTVISSQTVWAGDGRSNFSSCGDNHHGVWTGSDITNGNIGSACGGQWTSQIVCGEPLIIPQCRDGKDNDNDGAIDLADFSCGNNASGNNETNPKAQCQDGVDNDGDTLIDFPQDPGCDSLQDNTENSEPAPSVDLKINGQDGTITVVPGTVVTLSWTSAGVQRCDTGISNLPGWGSNQPLPVSGTRQLTISESGTFRIQCAKTLTSNIAVQDSVAAQLQVIPPNFSIQKSTTATTVLPGGTISYLINATNNGTTAQSNVVITDTPTGGLTFVQAGSTGSCAPTGSTVTCTVPTFSPGSQTFTLNFTVPAAIACGNSGNTVSNIASVLMNASTLVSSTTVQTPVICPAANFSVYKTDNRSTANVLDRLRYSIVLTNNSSTVVNSLLVTDNMPYGLTILTVSDGGTVSGQQVRWTDISVPANSNRTLFIDTEVRSDVSNGTIMNNTVDVSGKTATDQTTIYSNTYVNQPYYPPIYNPPSQYYPPVYNPPSPYYPPVYNPPPTYQPNPPPVYYPQNPPTIIYPKTGERSSNFFVQKNDATHISPVAQNAVPDENGFSAVFYATLLAFLAVGSAAANRFIGFGL